MAEENIKELTVSLISEDITRAAVKEEEFGKLTVNQLKCWLKCRRFSQSGNRQVIVLLCLSFFYEVTFVFVMFVIPVSSFLTGCKMFTIQTRTNHIPRPKLLNAGKNAENSKFSRRRSFN